MTTQQKRAPIAPNSNTVRDALARQSIDGTPFFYEMTYATSERGARRQIMSKVLDNKSKELINRYGFDLLVSFVSADDEFNSAKVDFWRYSIAKKCKA